MTISKAQVNHIIWCVVDETEVSYADSEFESINVPESSREELITHILDVVNNDLEVCPKCYNLIKEEDYETEFESRITAPVFRVDNEQRRLSGDDEKDGLNALLTAHQRRYFRNARSGGGKGSRCALSDHS